MRPALGALAVGCLVLLGVACGAQSVPVPASTEGIVMDGRGLYAANCARCHGGDLKGTTLGPPLLDAIYRRDHHADAAFAIAVRNGVRPHHWNFGPMPPVVGVTEQQVALITAFVRFEQESVGIR